MFTTDLSDRINILNKTNFIINVHNRSQYGVFANGGFELLKIMKEVTQEEPIMWGTSIIGFGSYHYRYASGREGDWPIAGFSPRKRSLTVYLSPGLDDISDLLGKLGKHRVGKGCLYINKLSDVDTGVLKKIVKKSIEVLEKRYGSTPA